mmetsp:Transcript_25258/g.63360  ORF Transcript_25258/g.63360 Transcript_25258/m.63360 type:complete len:85 (+) Transcript_25258:953-1207(+)
MRLLKRLSTFKDQFSLAWAEGEVGSLETEFSLLVQACDSFLDDAKHNEGLEAHLVEGMKTYMGHKASKLRVQLPRCGGSKKDKK